MASGGRGNLGARPPGDSAEEEVATPGGRAETTVRGRQLCTDPDGSIRTRSVEIVEFGPVGGNAEEATPRARTEPTVPIEIVKLYAVPDCSVWRRTDNIVVFGPMGGSGEEATPRARTEPTVPGGTLYAFPDGSVWRRTDNIVQFGPMGGSGEVTTSGGRMRAAGENPAGIPGGNQNQAANSSQNCSETSCSDLRQMVSLLRNDMADMQARMNDLYEEHYAREATGIDLEQTVAEQRAENERMKAELARRRALE